MADGTVLNARTFADAARGVIAMAHFAGARHWVHATSGNFSVRIDGRRAAVTATGADKARLTEGEVIEAEISGPKHPRASAEAPRHLMRYAADASVGAIAHVHPPHATQLSSRHDPAAAAAAAG